MSIYFSTNIPEMRSIIYFNRLGNDISEIVHRLETGQRINSGKDDPAGLIGRDSMRTDIKGIQSAQKNTMMANELLSSAESGLANISRMLIGDINNRDDNGLIGLIYDDTVPANMKSQQINDILSMINGTIRSTTYNGQQLLNGSMDYRIAGVDASKLSGVAVSRAMPSSASGQTITIGVLEQAQKGTLILDGTAITPGTDLNLRLEGTSGNSFEIHLAQGYTAQNVIDAINAETATSGVTARVDGTDMIFETADTGSRQTLTAIDLDSVLTFKDADGLAATTASGKDIAATINGIRTRGDGQQIRYLSDELSLSATVSSTLGVGQQTQFRVTGGGMVFQLGMDVQTALQYRMGLPSMTTANLGGTSGLLEDLRTIDLATDAGKAKAYAIVSEAVNQVAKQRGTIGAVQKSVLDSNANNLDIQLEKISEAEGLLSNADMAVESSRLNRTELLAQSAMDAVLYSRRFRQFILSSLLS